MVLFNHMRLAEQLGRGEVTEATKFYYYFIALTVCTLCYSTSVLHTLYAQGILNIYDYIGDAIFVVATLSAALVAFRVNASGDGQDLIARLTCLALPIAFQSIGVIVVVYFIGLLAIELLAAEAVQAQSSGDELSHATDGLDLTVSAVFALYFNAQLIRGIHRAAKRNPTASLTPTAA